MVKGDRDNRTMTANSLTPCFRHLIQNDGEGPTTRFFFLSALEQGKIILYIHIYMQSIHVSCKMCY